MKDESEGKGESSVASEKGFVDKMRSNPWMVVSIVLAIGLVVMIFMSMGGVTGNVVSENEVSTKMLAFAQAQGASGATVDSVVKSGDHYVATLNVGGQKYPFSVSLDGNYVLQPLGATAAGAGSQPTTTASKKISDLDLSQFPSVGSKDAKVTVVEFSDFSCPYCEAASGDNAQMTSAMQQRDSTWQPIVTNLMKDYVKTGKVRFVYVYGMGHTGGHPASLVGWCLNDQSSDMYWKYYPQVFASASADTEDLAKMTALAKGVGADMTKLQACLDSKKYDSRFASEQSVSDSVGVSGTPAFFVNNIYAAQGAESYVTFKQTIDSELAKAG